MALHCDKDLATVQPTAKLTHESADTRVFFDFIWAISWNSRATHELQITRVGLYCTRVSSFVEFLHKPRYVHLQE